MDALTVPGIASNNPVNDYYTFNVKGAVGTVEFRVNDCKLFIDFSSTSGN